LEFEVLGEQLQLFLLLVALLKQLTELVIESLSIFLPSDELACLNHFLVDEVSYD
jgi:hypothetical protein